MISVVIPIHNMEKYLDRCINSIIEQSYRNIEILLINDVSTDNSLKICKKFQKEDKRIKFFSMSHQGVSIARNFGIEKANGKYLLFIDSDDWIEKDTIEILYENIKNNDMSICSYHRVFENYNLIDNIKKLENDIILSKTKTLKILFLNGKYKMNYQGFIFNKLFKKKIIDRYNIRFDKDICYNEDRLFVFNYLLHCNKPIYFSKYIGYNYYRREGSVTNQKAYNEKMYTEFIAFDKMSKLAVDNKIDNLDRLIRNEYVNHSLQMFIKYNYLPEHVIKNTLIMLVNI